MYDDSIISAGVDVATDVLIPHLASEKQLDEGVNVFVWAGNHQWYADVSTLLHYCPHPSEPELIRTPVPEKAAALVPVNCSQYWFKRTSQHCCLLTDIDTHHTCTASCDLVHVCMYLMLCLCCQMADGWYILIRVTLISACVGVWQRCGWCGGSGPSVAHPWHW